MNNEVKNEGDALRPALSAVSLPTVGDAAAIAIAPRPTAKDEHARDAASRTMAALLIKDGLDTDEDDLTKWFMRQCEYGYFDNGYELAKDLEDDYYVEPDASMVETLDSARHELYSEAAKRVAQWIIDCGIKPSFGIGDLIEANQGRDVVRGTVRDIDMRSGYYVVDVGTKNSYPCVEWEHAKATGK